MVPQSALGGVLVGVVTLPPQAWSADASVEGLRAAIETEVTAYAMNHFRHGVSATFSKNTEVSLGDWVPGGTGGLEDWRTGGLED